jgi:hypothetical protein
VRGNREWIVGVMLCAGVAALALPAQGASSCAPSKGSVAVEIRVGAPIIDNTLPQSAVQRLAGKAYHGERTLGLYRTKLTAAWTVRLGRHDEDGNACFSIDRVIVHVAMPVRTIYITRERRPGSCAYESVLAHERSHQEIDDALLAEQMPRLRQRVADAIAALPPARLVPAARDAAAQQQITAPVAAAVKRASNVLFALRKQRQSQLDTPSEYRRVDAACG